MQRGSFLIRPVTLDIRVGPPIETRGYALEDRNRLIEVVRTAIEGLLRK